MAFAVGLFIAVHGAATFATVGLTFGNYLQTFVALPPVLVALALMAAPTAINVAGVTKASAVSAVLTTIQVLCLIGFAVFAFSLKGPALALKIAAPQDWGGVLQAAAIVFFIYSGYENMATLSEGAKDPGRDIWRAFMVALFVTTAVYIAVIFSVLALGAVRAVASSDFPLVSAAGDLGRWVAVIITGAALLATANAVLNASVSGSRLLFGMARAGDLPQALQRTLGKNKSLRYAKPDLKRPSSVPSVGRFPVTAGLGVASSLLLAAQYEWKVYLTLLLAILAGAIPYAFIRRRDRPRRAGATP